MRHGSLFSGGGGFDLAAEMAGWQNIFHCEKDSFCQKVLQHYWPEAFCFGDIKEFDGKRFRGAIDVISGGFPCQPFSAAGKRKGTSDDRYLWPEMLRIIKAIQPRWIVGENVYGLVNWNGGLVFEAVQSDLEAAGYDVTAFILPAAGINAPHQRYRVWIIAHNPANATRRKQKDHSDTHGYRRYGTQPCRKTSRWGKRRQRQYLISLCQAELEKADTNTYGDGCNTSNRSNEKLAGQIGNHAQRDTQSVDHLVADTDSKRQSLLQTIGNPEVARHRFSGSGKEWGDWPTQSPLCGGNDGLPAGLDGIAFQKWKEQSIKLYGNAIVPQVALQIFKAINKYELNLYSPDGA